MLKTEEKSRLFKALGEPARLRIIEFLLNKKQCTCICELAKYLKKDQSVVFRHVQVMKDAGIIETKKECNFKSVVCF